MIILIINRYNERLVTSDLIAYIHMKKYQTHDIQAIFFKSMNLRIRNHSLSRLRKPMVYESTLLLYNQIHVLKIIEQPRRLKVYVAIDLKINVKILDICPALQVVALFSRN